MQGRAKLFVLFAACGAACAMVTGFSSAASANDWLTLGKEGWIPSISAFGGVTVQNQEGTVDSSCARGGPGLVQPAGMLGPTFASCLGLPQPGVTLPTPAQLRPSARGNDWSVSPILGFDFQLLTPSLDPIPGRPRLFVRGEIQLTFGSVRNIAIEADPSEANIGGAPNNSSITTDGLNGTGSTVVSENRTLGWGAVAGFAFPFEFLGRRLWLKPGAAWTRYTVDADGVIEAGLKNDPAAGPGAGGGQGDVLRIISLNGGRSPTYDGIGPSLELEMDVGQFGPLGASLFLGGAVYKILGDRSVEFSTSESFPADPPTSPPTPARGLPADTYTANWTFEVDPWLIRGAVGFRLHWYGF
jgi:hypothetical protein